MGVRRTKLRGFTFAELMIGLVITAMVLLALAGMMTGVAQGWYTSDGGQALQIEAAHANALLNYNLAPALYIAQAGSGSAFYWANHNFGAYNDTDPHAGEMAYLKLIGTTLWLYQCKPAASLTGPQTTEAQASQSYNTITDPTWPPTFQNLDYLTYSPVAFNVKSAAFSTQWLSDTYDAAERPVLEYTIVFSRWPLTDFTTYGTVLMHAADPQPQ